MNYPFVYIFKSEVLDRVTMAIVVEQPNVWKTYLPDNAVVDSKDSQLPKDAFNDPKIGIKYIPQSMFNRLKETVSILENPTNIVLDDIIKEVNGLTQGEIDKALNKQYEQKQ